jgi:hypothetical protein
MKSEKFDFYSPVNLKSYNLDKTMRYQLDILGSLDFFTRRHSENVANLVCRICEYFHFNPKFTIYCTICGYLHDIGKLFIPSEILNKPDRLTDEEFEIMKTHTTKGYEMCMKDLKLRPYASGALNHHEALNGTGYPNGITKIPMESQIIRVADEYDAIVTKRQYTTHVNISETLRDLIKDAQPDPKLAALDHLSQNSKVGKINKRVLKVLFKVVIDDILYEISCLYDYLNYLKDNIKRLELILKYNDKMNEAKSDKKKEYYREGMKMLFLIDENFDNFKQVYEDYKHALEVRSDRVKKLYNEIKIIKKLEV